MPKRLYWYFKFLLRLIRAKIRRVPTPLIVVLCVTNKCNLKCWYCYGQHNLRSDWNDFTTKELLDIVSSLHNMGMVILQLQGGEPLLRDDLGVIIKKAKSLGIMCDMVTNGILISEKPDVVSLLDKICISLDGPAEINSRNRGGTTFNKTVEGIKIACNLGIAVRISAVITADTSKGDIDWLLNFAKENNILVNFSPSFDFLPSLKDSKLKPHNIPDRHLMELLRHIKKCKELGEPVQFSSLSYKVALDWPFSYEKRKAKKWELPADFLHPKCYHGKYIVFIDSDGSLYPCCNFWGDTKFNVRDVDLRGSINRLSDNNCAACYIPAYIDRNCFFSGKAIVWWNYVKQVLKGII